MGGQPYGPPGNHIGNFMIFSARFPTWVKTASGNLFSLFFMLLKETLLPKYRLA